MSEQDGIVRPAPRRPAIKIGLGAALVVLPLGAFGAYKHLEDAGERKDRGFEKGFTYDTTPVRQVDPLLIRYRELATIETGLESPRAIAVDPRTGDLLVAGHGLVRRLSPAGARLGDIAVSGEPFCLASGFDGRVFVGLKDHVEVYSAGAVAKLVESWKSFGLGSYLTCIAVAEDGVYVADAGRRVVYRCSPDGRVLVEIGRADKDLGIPGFIVPSPHLDVAIGSDGLVWVGNPGMHRLEAYTADGRLERYWGTVGTAVNEFFGCCNPTDFAMLSDGSFITSEKGIARIKRYDADGRFDCVVAAPQSFGGNVTGLDVATTAEGHVLVLERGTRAVRVFAPDDARAAGDRLQGEKGAGGS